MRKFNLLRLIGLSVATLFLTISQSFTQSFTVTTLVSPNKQVGGNFGSGVSSAGDVNGDGYADVIVGAWAESAAGSPLHTGRAYIFSGKSNSLLFELKSPNERENGLFGCSVSGIGDINLDGHADVIVGAYQESSGPSPLGAGRAYIFSGKDGSLLFKLVSPHEEFFGNFGVGVSGAGDVNLDGHNDVIVGAPEESPGTSPGGAGRAYVFSGKNGSLLFELVSPNEKFGGGFGSYKAVSGAGDVNLDGHADLIVGAHHESPATSPPGAGRAYVFSGKDGSVLYELVSPNEEQAARFGASVSTAGDINLDGYTDVIVGAQWENPGTSPSGAGRAYVFSGKDGKPLLELVSPNEKSNGEFGWSVSDAGDINLDGNADVIVGAFRDSPGAGSNEAGRAYIFSGKNGTLLLELASPYGQALGHFGQSVSAAGDVNGDGLVDLIVGSDESPDIGTATGAAYLFKSVHRKLIVTFEKVKLVNNAPPLYDGIPPITGTSTRFFFGVNGVFQGFPRTGVHEFPQNYWVILPSAEYTVTTQVIGLNKLRLRIHTELPGLRHVNPRPPYDVTVGPKRLLQVVSEYGEGENFGVGTHTQRSNNDAGYFEVTYRIETPIGTVPPPSPPVSKSRK